MTKELDFVLSLSEHDWEEEQLADLDATRLEALRRVRDDGWREAKPGEYRDLGTPEAQMTSLERFRELVDSQLNEMVEDAPFVAEVIAAVCERAAVLVESKKARVTAGWAYGFEGNHNDTTFLLRLSVPSSETPR
jgi:hypothetical protein